MTQVLHNICKLAVIETCKLGDITIIHGLGVMLNRWHDFEDLEISGLAQCEISSKVDNKSKLFTTTLSARLPEHFDSLDKSLAFLVTCVNGERFLIGTNEAPYPIVNTSDSFPGKTNEVSGCSLSVEFTDSLGLLAVLD